MATIDSSSIFAGIQWAPQDPFYSLVSAYETDEHPQKIDLGVGAYKDEHGRPWILPSVRAAEQIQQSDPARDHEYLPIAGLTTFTRGCQLLMFGDGFTAANSSRLCTFQTLSGTGALHLGGSLLAKFGNAAAPVYISDPSWPIHHQVFEDVDLQTRVYPYYSAATKSFDMRSMQEALQSAPAGSIIVLQACAHNPTGWDPTQEQWEQIAAIMQANKLFPFFDNAYQGFATGSVDDDAFAVRYFAERGFEMLVAQSLAKNMGLYGQRVGALHYLAPSGAQAYEMTQRVASQLSILQRSHVSSPPLYGATIAALILADGDLHKQWQRDLQTMSSRILAMRVKLRQALEAAGTPGSWSHITQQIGMFSFTGLSPAQVALLRTKWHCYMAGTGRISVAGLNDGNIDYFAKAMDDVVRQLA